MVKLKDKRYKVIMGFAVVPEETRFQYVRGSMYGKMKYEDMVQLQAVIAKYVGQLNELLTAMDKDLIEIGLAQADVVAGERTVDDQAEMVIKPDKKLSTGAKR